jgi:putative ABC transport system ATP-binding protein
MQFFSELNTRNGLTIVMVTHEDDVAAYAGRRIRFRDGHIESDESNGPRIARAVAAP